MEISRRKYGSEAAQRAVLQKEAIAHLSEHASPPSEGGKLSCRRFLVFTIP